MIDAGNHQVDVVKGVAATRLLNLLTGKQREGQAELLEHFILPLLNQTAGGDDQDALGVGPHQQFTDEQPGHDRFARAGVVCQHVAQGLARQHGFIDGGDLVRQRFDVGGMNRHHRIEQMRQIDPISFGSELEFLSGCIECPRATGFGQRQIGFVGTEEHALQQLAVRGLEIDGECVVADRFRSDDANNVPRLNTGDGRVFLDIFEFKHGYTFSDGSYPGASMRLVTP